MRPSNLTLHCMAWQEASVWVAVCIDLTLAVQGDSQADVKQKLHDQIAVYVHEAFTLDADQADALLTRRAPLRDRLRYAFWRAIRQRPRIRRTAAAFAKRVLPALRQKLAYVEPLPLRPV
jgi:hypothetical protein